MTNRFKSTLVQTWPPQTGANELDGSAGKGYLKLHDAMRWLGVFGHADAPLDWEVDITLPNPKTPASPVTFKFLSVAAQADIVDAPEIPLPAGTIVTVKTTNSAGSNPTVQFVTQLLPDEN